MLVELRELRAVGEMEILFSEQLNLKLFRLFTLQMWGGLINPSEDSLLSRNNRVLGRRI